MPLAIRTRTDETSKHGLDLTCFVFHNNKLYSAADDGKIKLWEPDLKLIAEVQAHPCSVFSITIGGNILYSCSNDGTIKAWSSDTLKSKGTLLREESEQWKVCFNAGRLYAGDDHGLVKIFENNRMVGILEIMHPIADLLALDNMIYTARDLYVIISEIFPGEKRMSPLQAFHGRAPVCVVGDKLCFPSRTGRDIYIHDNSKTSDFKDIGQIKDAHDMIINTLCGTISDGNTYLFTGGWDKVLKRWKIGEDSSAEMVDVLSVEVCITCLTAGLQGQIYVGGGDGNIFCINIQP